MQKICKDVKGFWNNFVLMVVAKPVWLRLYATGGCYCSAIGQQVDSNQALLKRLLETDHDYSVQKPVQPSGNQQPIGEQLSTICNLWQPYVHGGIYFYP